MTRSLFSSRVARVLAALFLASFATAQVQFALMEKRNLPRTFFDEFGNANLAGALGDVDGDGDLDFVAGLNPSNDTYQLRLMLNDGRGVFVDAGPQYLPSRTQTASFFDAKLLDLDGDGDLDLVGGNTSLEVYLNDGTGRFTDVTNSNASSAASLYNLAMALGDVDGDGDPDLVLGQQYRQARLYLNDGTGVFIDVTAGQMPTVQAFPNSLAMADVDGDGDLDVVMGDYNVPTHLFLNNGSGFFTDGTATRIPVTTIHTNALAAGDVDADGDVDLLMAVQTQVQLLLNDGTGVFTDATATHMPVLVDYALGLELVDVDGDGDLDLAVARGTINQVARSSLYLNDGAGAFTDMTATNLPHDPDMTSFVVAGDVDGDGDPDLIFGAGRERLHINAGNGVFAQASEIRIPSFPNWPFGNMALGDVDGDGDLDLALAVLQRQNQLLLNDGAGYFEDATARLPVDQDRTQGPAFGDVDGDGDVDLIFANQGERDRLLLNDGSGTFVRAPLSQFPAPAVWTTSLALSDLDGDGDLDLLEGYANLDRLYLNDGSGTFVDVAASHLPSPNIANGGFAVGDVDGDGDPDVVAANPLIYVNDGTARFSVAPLPTLPAPASLVTMGDVDGDGDLDLFFRLAIFRSHRDALLINDGSGTFVDESSSRLPSTNYAARSIAMFDMENDGDLDLMLVGDRVVSDRAVKLYENDGRGYFSDVTSSRLPTEPPPMYWIAAGDVDADGDTDLVTSGYFTGQLVWTNLTQQIDSPFLVVSGRSYQLDLYSRHGLSTAGDLAVPFLAAGTARISLPGLGVFGLDPTRTVVLPAVPIPRPAGLASLVFTVPAVPAAAGITLHAQALVARQNTPWRLTAVVSDEIAQ